MATKRFFSLIKQKDNAEIIEEEIRAIQGKYGPEEKLSQAPCPYALFLLAAAWCVDLETHYTSGVSFDGGMLDAWMGSTEGDNNDGITVIDITEPTNPSYCFVSIYGLEAGHSVEDRVPLSAEQYARAYYPVPTNAKKEKPGVMETEEDVQRKIDSLRDERLMTVDVLAEAWPKEYKRSSQTSAEDPAPASNPIPSLVDLSLKPAVEYGVQTGETGELEGLVWLPGKANLIKSVLRQQNPFPDSGMPLMVKVVEHEAESDKTMLDLSGLPLSGSQLIHLLTHLEMKNSIERLKLSHNPNITIDVLRQVLPTTPNLRRLVLLDTSISKEQIHELLTKDAKLLHTLEELVHPALLSWPESYPPSFQYLADNGQSASSVSVAVFTPAALIQSLTDYLSPIANLPTFEIFSFLGSSLVPQMVFASGVRSEGDLPEARRVHCIPSRQDAPFDDGKGWMFAATWDMFGGATNRYGFVAKAPGDSGETWKIYDLKAFLKEMALEGRPPPSEAAVQKLEGIFALLDSSRGAKLWTEPDFLGFIKRFTMLNRRYY